MNPGAPIVSIWDPGAQFDPKFGPGAQILAPNLGPLIWTQNRPYPGDGVVEIIVDGMRCTIYWLNNKALLRNHVDKKMVSAEETVGSRSKPIHQLQVIFLIFLFSQKYAI